MIGVIGNSNAGKSTLVNAILGQRILPTDYKSCTSVITNVSLVDVPTPLLKHDGGERQGKQEIRAAIEAMNELARGSTDTEVRDVSLFCKPSPKGTDAALPCDGMLTLVDMPGFDETDNEVVKKCLTQLLSMCHGLWILTKWDAVKSDGLARLIKRVEESARHLLFPGAIRFVITQADSIRFDVVSDKEDEVVSDEEVSPADDLKNVLRQILTKRLPQHKEFVKHVEILATSIDQKLRGGHDFFKLFEIMSSTRDNRKQLIYSRKSDLTNQIVSKFKADLSNTSASWPQVAGQAIESRKSWIFWTSVAVVGTVVTIPLGGAAFWYACAIRGGAAVAAAVGTAVGGAMAGAAAERCTLGGKQVVGVYAVGAEGAEKALEHLRSEQENAKIVVSEIQSGSTYKDAKMFKGKVLYVGEFKEKTPDGFGRLFWPGSQYEAFMGKFERGEPVEGIFLNEDGFFVGRMKLDNNSWTVSGYQADDPSEDPSAGVCVACKCRPSLVVEHRCFAPCGHGHVCSDCAKELTQCPMPTCQKAIERIMRI